MRERLTWGSVEEGGGPFFDADDPEAERGDFFGLPFSSLIDCFVASGVAGVEDVDLLLVEVPMRVLEVGDDFVDAALVAIRLAA